MTDILPCAPILGVLLVLLLATDVRAQQSTQSFSVGLYQNSPKVFRDSNGKPSGLFVDILDAVAAERGWTLRYVDCDWQQCLDMLEAGELDLMPDVALTSDRTKRFDFHQQSVVSSFSRVYAPDDADLRSFSDLDEKTVAVLAGSSQEQELDRRKSALRSRISLARVESFERAFELVRDGQADAAVTNHFFGDRSANEYDLKPTPVVFQPAQLYYAATPDRHAQALSAIDESLHRWQDDGPSPYYTALQKWTAPKQVERLPDWLGSALTGGFVLLGLAGLAIVTLRRQVNIRTEHLDERNTQLRRNQRHLSLIVDHGPDMVAHVGSDGRVVFINEVAKQICGREPGDVLGGRFIDLFVDDLPPEHVEKLTCVAEEASAFRTALMHADGRIVPVEVRMGSVRGEKDESTLCQFIVRDLSERVAAVRALARSEARAERIIQRLPLATMVWRREDDAVLLESINDAAAQLFAEAEEDALGNEIATFYDDGHPIRAVIESCFLHRSGARHEIELNAEDGDAKRKLVATSGFLGPDSVIVHCEDITEQEALRRKLSNTQRMETAGMLAGGVAHDFNNLLTVINSSAQLALAELDDSETAKDDLEQILEAGERAADVTRQLLTFSRGTVAEPKYLQLSETVENLESMLQRFVEESITLEFSRDSANDWVYIDPSQVEQIVLNLVINARDAIEKHGTISVSTRIDENDKQVILTVEDDGRGMDSETQERIFEPFFTTKEGKEGTGLGLASVYGAVTDAGGEIEVDSRPGEGTRFVIRLPLVDEPRETPEVVAPHTDDAPTSARILVVEDEPQVRSVVARLLRREGYEVVTAASVDAATSILQERSDFDVIITDVIMPEKSGAALAEYMKMRQPNVPLIFISGYTDEHLTQHGLENDGVEILMKPIQADELHRRVQKVTSQASA